MKKMTSNEIRNSWIEYFKKNNHTFIKPKSLVPENDPSLLWINSGVATLKDYFSGKKNPPSPRLVNSQKAIRTNDFFNVGITSRHHTFFEMLGNFSIGDYFKLEAIEFAYNLLTKEWEIDSNLLWITVFEDDLESYNKWISLGIIPSQIIKCNAERNFWDVGMGPCGPCTEIHYDRGEKYDPDKLGSKLILEDIENDRYVEIWNIVFSQYNNDGNNNYTELARKNIDTGAGLERLASISQDVPTNFDTDLFLPIIRSVEQYSINKYDINAYFTNDEKQSKINFAYRVISDHLRASVFAISDGIVPSNKERGYILRRLLRRMLVYIHNLKIVNQKWLIDGVESIILIMGQFYSNLNEEKTRIINTIQKEISLFEITLKQGMKILESSINEKQLDANTTFKLVTTYGFPIELINEFAKEKNLNVDVAGFEKLYEEHQKISNANKNIVGMEKQNSAILDLNIESRFEYNSTELNSKVIKLFNNDFVEVEQLINEDGYVIVEATPFYATSGGQIHDTGYINNYYVDDVFKAPNFQHIHHVLKANLQIEENVHLAINVENRRKNMAHHSSEHILQAALKNIIDENIKQKGAFKSPEKLTFDFQLDYKLSDQQLLNIENWVNEYIQKHHHVDVLFMNLDEAKCELIAKNLEYFRISLDAGSAEMYKKIHGMKPHHFQKTIDNIKMFAKIKKELDSKVSFGVGFLTNSETQKEIESFIQIVKESGADFAQFRPFIGDTFNVLPQLKILKEKYETENFKIVASYQKYKEMKAFKLLDRGYQKCHGMFFSTVISADFKVWACLHFRQSEKHLLGDLRVTTLEDIWRGSRIREVYNSINCDECPILCRNDSFNKTLEKFSNPIINKEFL